MTDDYKKGLVTGLAMQPLHVTNESGGATFPPSPIMYTFKPFTNIDPTAGGGFEFKSKDDTTKFSLSENGIQLSCNNAANRYHAHIGADRYLTANVIDGFNSVNTAFFPDSFSVSGSTVRKSGNGDIERYHLDSANGGLHAYAKDSDGTPGAEISINGDALVINYGGFSQKYRLYLSAGDFTISSNGKTLLSVSENGLYVNGKKVLTEA